MLAANPEKLMNPLFPPHVVGLVEVTDPATGVGGAGLTVTETVAEGDVHPATVWVTLII